MLASAVQQLGLMLLSYPKCHFRKSRYFGSLLILYNV